MLQEFGKHAKFSFERPKIKNHFFERADVNL